MTFQTFPKPRQADYCPQCGKELPQAKTGKLKCDYCQRTFLYSRITNLEKMTVDIGNWQTT